MAPFFSIFRRSPSPPPVAEDARSTSEDMPASNGRAETVRIQGASSPEQPLSTLLARLESYLPPPSPGLPANRLSPISITQRRVGLGNWRGTERQGGFAEVALKGGRLEVVVRFLLWGDSLEAVEEAADGLHRGLLADNEPLRRAGFLWLRARDATIAEHTVTPDGWRKSTEYELLYEYHYDDADGAESLIARIPVHSDLEQHDSAERETAQVSDALVRWDDRAAPPLVISASVGHPARIFGLSILATLPAGWGGAQVTLARLRRDAAGAPTDYSSLDTFLDAVTRHTDPDYHARFRFASAEQFLAAFATAGETLEMGDWNEDGVADGYRPARLTFDTPVVLSSSDDVLQIDYSEPQLDSKAVLYLRAVLGR